MKAGFLFSLFALFTLQVTLAGSFHVRVNGSSSGNGTITSPWDLQTALNHPTKVNGGDTIWVHEGTYNGIYTSTIYGRSNAPIIVRAVPGFKVILDGNKPGAGDATLNIKGEYTHFWGFVITNTNGVRGNNATDLKDGVYFGAPNCKLINCIIHNNGGNGVGFWRPAINSEIYGCIIYNNGYRGNDRGHGHGVYGQNETGTKQIRNNILFNSFGLGMSIYTEGGAIQGFNIEGNIMFNSGLPGNDFLERHILIGGLRPADRETIKSNYLYNRPNYPSKAGIQLGYGSENVKAEVTGNYMVDGSFYVITNWNSVKFTGNSILSRSTSMQLISFDNFKNIASPDFNNNNYYFGKLSTHQTFDAWKVYSGQDKNSTYSASLPTNTYYVLQKNQYEPERGHLVIYNWGKQNSINVDLSQLLTRGSEYKIYDVSNLKAGPLLTGTYSGGNVAISMQLTSVELPFGDLPNNGKFIHTAPDFGAFLIIGTPSNGPPVNDPTVPNQPDENASTPLRILNFHPNPTVDILAVDFYSPDENKVVIDVVDNMGRTISSESYLPKEGKNTHVLNLATYAAGIYFISITSGNKRVSCKVMKRDFALNSGDGSNAPDSDQEMMNGLQFLIVNNLKRNFLIV